MAGLLWDFFFRGSKTLCLAPGPIFVPNNIDMRLLSTGYNKALKKHWCRKRLLSWTYIGTVENSLEWLILTRMVCKRIVFRSIKCVYIIRTNFSRLIFKIFVDMRHQSTSNKIISISEFGWFFLFQRPFVSACRNNILHCYCYGSISRYIFSKLFQREGYSAHKSGCKRSKNSNVFPLRED